MLFWNVAGAKTIKNTINVFESYNVVIFVETWLTKEKGDLFFSSLDCDFRWTTLEAKKTKQRGRAAGGIVIGINGKKMSEKTEIGKWKYGLNVKVTDKSNDEKRKIKIIAVYNNATMKELEKELGEQVEEGIESGERVIIIGDINARTGEMTTNAGAEDKRSSQDKKCDANGKRLLRFCEEKGLKIKNGRTKGDEEGKYTFVSGSAASVLDYVIESDENDEGIVEEMKVIKRIESDHMPIMVKIKAEGGEMEGNDLREGERQNVTEKLRWKKEKYTKYAEIIVEKLKEQTEEENTREELREPNWDDIKETIQEAARGAGMTSSGVRKKGGKKAEWYNEDCSNARRRVWKALKEFWRLKTNEEREELSKEKKNYKQTRKRALGEWMEIRWKEIRKSRTIGDWWEAVNKFRGKKRKMIGNIRNEEWVKYFKRLLNQEENDDEENEDGEKNESERNETEVENEESESDDENELNKGFSEKEIRKAIESMKNKKAPGSDEITTKFLKMAPEVIKNEIVMSFKDMWEREEIPKDWELARIMPIHKCGEENEPGNYRGISLLNVGYKMMTKIMTTRLTEWCKKEGILRESQAGFREERGTRDHIFVLNGIIENKLKQAKGKLYVAFIDFKAAFDRVNRRILMKKLTRNGINGKMKRMIEKIYEETRAEVITRDGKTESLKVGSGVRQGCALSATLFNIYIDDMDEEWKKRNIGGSVIGNEKIYALKYADDVAVIAESAEELQAMIETLEGYVDKIKMEVNVKKTKVMIFKRGGKEIKREKFEYKGQEIEKVKEFKYLGYWFTPRNKSNKHVKEMKGRAMVSANAVWGTLKRAKIGTLKARLYLMEAIARAGAIYGIEIWGWEKWKEMQKVQNRYTKMAMGLARNTPEYIWLEEAEKEEMEMTCMRRTLRYWGDIVDMKEDRWPGIVLREECRCILNGNESRWGEKVKERLQKCEAEEIIRMTWKKEDSEKIKEKIKEALERMEDMLKRRRNERIENSRYWDKFKAISGEGTNEYWKGFEMMDWEKECWAKMRCGNVGRGGKPGYKEEGCRLCKEEGALEDIKHILSCEKVEAERERDNKRIEQIKRAWRDKIEEGNWDETLIRTLRGDPDKELCWYIREWEKSIKRKTDDDEREAEK